MVPPFNVRHLSTLERKKILKKEGEKRSLRHAHTHRVKERDAQLLQSPSVIRKMDKTPFMSATLFLFSVSTLGQTCAPRLAAVAVIDRGGRGYHPSHPDSMIFPWPCPECHCQYSNSPSSHSTALSCSLFPFTFLRPVFPQTCTTRPLYCMWRSPSSSATLITSFRTRARCREVSEMYQHCFK